MATLKRLETTRTENAPSKYLSKNAGPPLLNDKQNSKTTGKWQKKIPRFPADAEAPDDQLAVDLKFSPASQLEQGNRVEQEQLVMRMSSKADAFYEVFFLHLFTTPGGQFRISTRWGSRVKTTLGSTPWCNVCTTFPSLPCRLLRLDDPFRTCFSLFCSWQMDRQNLCLVSWSFWRPTSEFPEHCQIHRDT